MEFAKMWMQFVKILLHCKRFLHSTLAELTENNYDLVSFSGTLLLSCEFCWKYIHRFYHLHSSITHRRNIVKTTNNGSFQP